MNDTSGTFGVIYSTDVDFKISSAKICDSLHLFATREITKRLFAFAKSLMVSQTVRLE